MNQRNKIGVLCQYPFPVGMAATTRILSYGKGLVENGADVEVYSFFWRGDDSPEPIEGDIEGVKYIIPCRYHTKRGKFYHVFIDKRNIYTGIINRIKQSHKVQPFNCILISFDAISYYRYFLPRIASIGIPMAFIGDEFPQPIRMLKKDIPVWDKIRYKFYHSFFRKRVLMTKALQDYYNEEILYKPTYILNSVLDEKRFVGVQRQHVERSYFCYMGNMQLKKDNVDNIINAFSMIAQDFPDYDLYLYGTPDDADRMVIENCILSHSLEKRVFIKGRVDYSEVPQILTNATILLTSQPDTKRAEGGFPTKMGEYMMSHTPMLVTDVGEIHLYVQDGVNTFMVPPQNPQAYADKLRYIINNPEKAQLVSDNAYNYAICHFTAKVATKDMLTFLVS